jgi:DNA-binding transcriptional LysR family regulator
MQPIAWDDLRYVLALARFATIAEAARRLSVDEATVGRRIARIERQLGARLFDRAQGKLVPTEAEVRRLRGQSESSKRSTGW